MACITPFYLKNKMNNEKTPTPCGQCPPCLSRKVSAWSFRLNQEQYVSSSADFLTLTYDTKHLPFQNYRPTVRKKDIQDFMKRLRKLNQAKLKYFIAAEYGEETHRPHYHLILFNAKINTVQKAWGLGQVNYGDVNLASIGYSLKYISKPPFNPEGTEKPFRLMSKGLGKNYITPNMIEWHKADIQNRMYVNLDDGKKASMPRYYKEKIYNKYEKKAASAHQRIVSEKLLQTNLQRIPEFYHRKAIADAAAFKKNSKKSQLKSLI